jgi:hypothetical protein
MTDFGMYKSIMNDHLGHFVQGILPTPHLHVIECYDRLTEI